MTSADKKTTHLKDQFQRLIPHISGDTIDALMVLVGETDIDVSAPPKTGLLMMTVKDCFDTDFHLGEVLVTTAEVAAGNRKAHAMVIGQAPKTAVLSAALELLPVIGPSRIISEVQSVIDALLPEVTRQKDQEDRLAAATRVDFESMKKEKVDFGSLV